MFMSLCLVCMKSIVKRQYFTVCLIAGLLSAPAIANAADSISLNGQEKKRMAEGEIIVREIGTAGKKGRTFEAIALVKAPRVILLRVLKDYGKYPEFMPNVSRIEIVEQSGNNAVLNYTLTLPMGKTKKYRLRISESAPGKQLSILEWQMLKWPELKSEESIADTTGFWRIEDKGENTSLLLYHVYTDPGPIPFGLGWIADLLGKKSVPEVLLQTAHRAEKLTQPNPGKQDK